MVFQDLCILVISINLAISLDGLKYSIDIISYQLFWSKIQLISRNQRAVSPSAQNLSHDCLLDLCIGNKNEHTYIHTYKYWEVNIGF